MVTPTVTQFAGNTTLAITELQNVTIISIPTTITPTAGDLVVWSSIGSPALGDLAGVATGNVLLSAGVGVIPAWGQVDISTSVITGNLGVSHLNSGTSASATTFWRGDASWAAVPAQTMVLLSTLTPSAVASVQDTTSLTSSYDSYLVVLENVIPANNNVQLQAQLQVSGVFQTTGYINASSDTTFIRLSGPNPNGVANSDPGVSSTFFLTKPSSTTVRAALSGDISYLNAGTSLGSQTSLASWYNTTGNAVTGIKFLFSAGNITSGTIKIYGIVG